MYYILRELNIFLSLKHINRALSQINHEAFCFYSSYSTKSCAASASQGFDLHTLKAAKNAACYLQLFIDLIPMHS